MKHPASANEVRGLLGDVDPLALERIVSTGATADEIVEALREESDERASGVVAEVRAALYDVLDDDRDDDEWM